MPRTMQGETSASFPEAWWIAFPTPPADGTRAPTNTPVNGTPPRTLSPIPAGFVFSTGVIMLVEEERVEEGREDAVRNGVAEAEAGIGANNPGSAPENVMTVSENVVSAPENVVPISAQRDMEAEDKETLASSGRGEIPSSSSSSSPPFADEKENADATPPEEQQSPPQKAALKGQSDDPEATRSKGKTAIIMFSLGLAVFLAALDVTIITTALPTIAARFNSSTGYTWIGSAYLLGNAASTPTWGKLSDIWGRKPMLLVANAVFFLGSLLAAVSINIGMLITARAIQGIGGGGLVSLVNIVISDLFSMRRRGAFYGIIGGVWSIASSVGPLIGGAFTEKVSWRWCFYINLPLDGLAFAILLFFLDIPTPHTAIVAGLKAVDWLGSLTVVGGTVMLLLGLEFGGVTYPWSSAKVICLIVFGFVLLAIFAIVEWKFAKYPVTPLRLFHNSSNIAVFGVCFIHGFVFIAGSYFLPLYFQAVIGATPLLSGVYILAQAGALSVSSVGTGIIIKKTGKYLPLIQGAMAIMTLGFGLFINLPAQADWAKIILYQIVAGLGIGPLFQAPLIALHSGVQPQDRATATAAFGFVRNMGTSISVVVGGVLFQNQMAKYIASYAANGILNPAAAAQLGGGTASASVGVVNALPPAERIPVREAFTYSLKDMWIMYTAFAGVGLLVSFFIRKKVLTTKHETIRTGLAAQEEARLEMVEQKKKRRSQNAGEQDSV